MYCTLFLQMMYVYKDSTIFPVAPNSLTVKSQLFKVAGPIENDRQSCKNITMLDIVDLDEVADLKQRVFELEKKLEEVYMLCANHGSGQSMDCAAQSMDPCFARAIHGLPSTCAIHGLRNHTACPRFVDSRFVDSQFVD